MIFYIDDTLVLDLETNKQRDQNVKAIESVITSQIQLNHFFYSSRQNLLKMIEIPELNERMRTEVIRAYNRFSQNGFLYQIPTRIELISGLNTKNITRNNHSMVIRISTDLFNQSKFCERPIFLTENTNDGRIYKQMVNYYLQTRKLHNIIKAEFKLENGGGSVTANQLRFISNEGVDICFCILDSDKSFPTDRIGETLKEAYNALKQNQDFGCCLIMALQARELENLLPIGLLHKLSISNAQSKEFISTLGNLSTDGKRYVDVKCGIYAKNFCLSTNTKLRDFWLAEFNSIYDCGFNSGECLQISCKEIPGLGKHIVRNLIDKYDNTEGWKMIFGIVDNDPFCKAEWIKIGNEIFEWFCSPISVKNT